MQSNACDWMTASAAAESSSLDERRTAKKKLVARDRAANAEATAGNSGWGP